MKQETILGLPIELGEYHIDTSHLDRDTIHVVSYKTRVVCLIEDYIADIDRQISEIPPYTGTLNDFEGMDLEAKLNIERAILERILG